MGYLIIVLACCAGQLLMLSCPALCATLANVEWYVPALLLMLIAGIMQGFFMRRR